MTWCPQGLGGQAGPCREGDEEDLDQAVARVGLKLFCESCWWDFFEGFPFLLFFLALIRGWAGAKAPASLSPCAGNGGRADGRCVGGGGGWHREQLFGMTETGSLVGTELQRASLPAELLQGPGSVCFQGDAASKCTQPLSEERHCSVFLRWPLENTDCCCARCWYKRVCTCSQKESGKVLFSL